MKKISKYSKIFVAGHKGMVGSAIYRNLISKGYKNILIKSRKELDLLDQKKTFSFLKKNKPKLVILAAAKVGGIIDNYYNKDKYIYENSQVQNNVVHGSFLAGVKNLFFLGSSCIYPKKCKQPMKEEHLLSGPLENTNEAYCIAKISGVKMCEYYSDVKKLNFKSFMPPNLYGPNDNYNLISSHFYPALLRKIYTCKKKGSKKLKLWGTGKARRETMFVEDFANALTYFMNIKIKEPYINIGTGKQYSINWYAKFMMRALNIKLKIIYDKSKPDGMRQKCMDISLAKKYGWRPPKDNLLSAFEITLKDLKKNLNF